MSLRTDQVYGADSNPENEMTKMDSDQKLLKVEGTVDPSSNSGNCINTNLPNPESGSDSISVVKIEGVSGAYTCKICMSSAASQQELDTHFDRHHNISVKVSRIVMNSEKRMKRETTGKASSVLKSIKNEEGFSHISLQSLESSDQGDIQQKLMWMCKEMNVVSPRETAQLRMLLRMRCTICYVDFRDEDVFHEHLRLHLDGLIDTCPHCGMNFQHKLLHKCSPTFANRSSLLWIEKRRQSQNTTWYKTSLSNVTNRSKPLSQEVRDSSNFILKCSYCHLRFKNKAEQSSHLLTEHGINLQLKKAFICYLCQSGNDLELISASPFSVYQFITPAPLITHLRKYHPSCTPLQMLTFRDVKHSIKNTETNSVSPVDSDYFTPDPDTTNRKCEAGVSFYNKQTGVISGGAVCPYCKQIYATTWNLNKHIRLHHATVLPSEYTNKTCGMIRCRWCPCVFPLGSEDSLSRHMISAHKDKVIGDRQFSFSNIRRGTITGGVVCPYCKQSYIHIWNLNKHIRLHHATVISSEYTNETRGCGMISCRWCPCVFRSKDSLSRHMLSAHKHKAKGNRKQAEPAPTGTETRANKHTGSERITKQLNPNKPLSQLTKTFPCSKCQRLMSTKQSLLHHIPICGIKQRRERKKRLVRTVPIVNVKTDTGDNTIPNDAPETKLKDNILTTNDTKINTENVKKSKDLDESLNPMKGEL